MKYLKLFKESVDDRELISAARRGDVREVERLIKAGVHLDISDNDGGCTALILASYYNRIEVVKLLIEAEANLNIRDNRGNTALKLASYNNNIEIVKLLLENFADECILDDSGWSFYDYLNDGNKKIIKGLYPNEVENAIHFSQK
jgi:ankyrin repeat protein